MPGKIVGAWLLFWWIPCCFGAPGVDASKQAVRTLSSDDMLHWMMGLLIVLSIFFFCVWAVRKLSGITVNGAEKMRIVGGLSLGMREKVVLLQVGKKQLILGVTPGRIEALHVLEGDDCLSRDDCKDAGGTTPRMGDDCMDAGGRATQGAVAEVEQRRERLPRAPTVGALGDAGAVAGEPASNMETGFAQKLAQAIKGRSDA